MPINDVLRRIKNTLWSPMHYGTSHPVLRELTEEEEQKRQDRSRHIQPRLDRIELTLATFIAWSARDLGDEGVNELLNMLYADDDPEDKKRRQG